MKKLLLMPVMIAILISCRKPVDQSPLFLPCTSNCDYNKYSTSEFDSVGIPIHYLWPFEPVILSDEFNFFNPIFNPNNSCEFLYMQLGLTQSGLFKFSTETGESTLITQEFYYNADWGSNGWILFTGISNQVFKIKENGDSLTQLTDFGSFSNAGTLNPTSNLFFIKRPWNVELPGYSILNLEGEVIHTINNTLFEPIDWLSDTELLGELDGKLFSLSIPYENLTLLNSSEVHPYNTYEKILDRENMTCYSEVVVEIVGEEDIFYFIRYDLNGTNGVDTLTRLYHSYRFGWSDTSERIGDVQDGKMLIELQREEIPDSMVIETYIRNNILIMDLDCNSQRMMELP